MDKDKIEKKSLVLGAWTNFFMAVCGWWVYSISNSESLLLDGNFSFIAFLSVLVAIRISSVKLQRSEIFPFGQFVYESLFSFMKGIMTIGMLLMALGVNIYKILQYLRGQPTQLLDTDSILIYTIAMVLLCFALSLYYKLQNKKLENSSIILLTEYVSVKIDGFISLGIGIALVGIQFIDIESNFKFLHYIGDALLVIFLVLIFGKEPFAIVRDSFIELAGGTLQNVKEKNRIEDILKNHLADNNLFKNSYISKTGSSYLVLAYVSAPKFCEIGCENIQMLKDHIVRDLQQYYPHIVLEIALQ